MNVTKFILKTIFLIAAAQVYNEERFREIYDLQSAEEKRNADATLTLVDSSLIKETPDGKIKIARTSNIFIYNQLCPGETFAGQINSGYCSGVLVAPDVIATAGHCLLNIEFCKKTKFVFDFESTRIETPSGTQPKNPSLNLNPENVYSCSELLHQELSEKSDIALIKLDRPVTGRTPVTWQKTSNIKKEQSIYVIGSPLGMPLKSSQGRVVDSSQQSMTWANYYNVGGMSGGPIFNSETHELIGINNVAVEVLGYDKSGCAFWYYVDSKYPDYQSIDPLQIYSPIKTTGMSGFNPLNNFRTEFEKAIGSKRPLKEFSVPASTVKPDSTVE